MIETIDAYIYTLNCAAQRMKLYRDTGESKYLVDSEMYLRVANIYMKEIMVKDAKEYPQYV
jgi:methionine synthase II (cobalamin-independent)